MGLRLLILFTLLLPLRLMAQQVADLSASESIDDFFGRISQGATGRSCADASFDEYVGFRCGLNNYYYDGDAGFATRSGTAFFEGVTDGVVFNEAAQSVYRANKCQKDFYDLYFGDAAQQEDLLSEAVIQFNARKGAVAARKNEIDRMYRADMCDYGGGSSLEAINNMQNCQTGNDHHLVRDAELSQKLSAIPMGNRPQMRAWLLKASEQNLNQQQFREGYNHVMRQLQSEASQSFNKIAEHSRPMPNRGPDAMYFDIDAKLRQELISSGIIHNVLAEHQLENYAKNTNMMCRIDRRNEGMWVGAGAELVASVAAAYFTGGASATVTPYVLGTMRLGSIVRRLSTAGRALGALRGSVARAATMRLLLFGVGGASGVGVANQIEQTCFTDEFLSSRNTRECNAQNQLLDVINESSVVQCALSAGLGVALPGGMVAAHRIGLRRAARLAAVTPPPTVLDDASTLAGAASSQIVVAGTVRRDFALTRTESTQLANALRARNITGRTTLTDAMLRTVNSDERLHLVEEIANTAFTERQGRQLMDLAAQVGRSGWGSNQVSRLTRLLRDSGVDAADIPAAIAKVRRQRVLDSVADSAPIAAPTPPRAPAGTPPSSQAELIDQFATRRITNREQNARYLRLAESTRRQDDIIFVDMQNMRLRELNGTLQNKPFIDALNNRHSTMLQDAIQGLRSRYPTLRIEAYSDYKGMRFAVTGTGGQRAQVLSELRRASDEVDARFLTEMRSGRYGNIESALDSPWYRTGIDDTSELANLAVRRGLTPEQIRANWANLRTTRSRLEADFGNTPLMRAVNPIQGGSSAKIPTAEVFELLRKDSLSDAQIASMLSHRHNLSLDATSVARFRQYAREIDEFSPNQRIDVRVNHDFSDATNGGLTLDFGGVGALNMEATAEGLAQGFDLSSSVRRIRLNEEAVTTYLREVDSTTTAAIRNELRRHNLDARITMSGDDMVVIPTGPLTPAIRDAILVAQAQAQATLLHRTGRNTNVRVSYFGQNLAGDDRAILAAEGEYIEKYLRARLERHAMQASPGAARISYQDMRTLTFGTDMLGSARGTGSVTLRTNRALTPAQQQVLEQEFRGAVADANREHSTAFTTN